MHSPWIAPSTLALFALSCTGPVLPADAALSTETKLTAPDGAANDYFGQSVSGAGDLDGDGYDDLVVGVPYDDDNGSASGSAYVWYGSGSGLDSASADKLTAPDGAANDRFGTSVSGAGDLDGDGYDDLVVGAWLDDENGSGSGSAYVWYGLAGGIDSASLEKLAASDGATEDHFGYSVSDADDIDGDGYDDLVVGAYDDDDESGSAYVYYGSATGIDGASEDKLTASDGMYYDHFGYSVSGAGDLDGDGYGDLMVGASGDDWQLRRGRAYVYYGSATGIDSTSEYQLRSDAPTASDFDYFGESASGAGDLDGDGYSDLVVGAWGDDRGGNSGAAYVWYGSAGGIDRASEEKLTVYGAHRELGAAVSGAGDLDGDGHDDLVVGADDGRSGRGSVYRFYGSAAGIDSASSDRLTASDGEAEDYFGQSVSGAGDLDGDGYGDLVVGVPYDDDAGSSSGSAYVYRGCRRVDGDGYCGREDAVAEDNGECGGCASSPGPSSAAGVWLLLGLLGVRRPHGHHLVGSGTTRGSRRLA